MSSYTAIKAKNDSRLGVFQPWNSHSTLLQEEKRLLDRKRNTLILIHKYLVDQCYVESADKLLQETGVSSTRFTVADNIDLIDIIQKAFVLNALQQYEEYFEIKFSKKPVLVRSATKDEFQESLTAIEKARKKRPSTNPLREALKQQGVDYRSIGASPSLPPPPANVASKMAAAVAAASPASGQDLTLTGSAGQEKEDDREEYFSTRLLKPLPYFDEETRALAQVISRDIYSHNPNVHWDDIIGLEDAKRVLREAVIMPVRYPQLFTGLLSPWHGMLLFGPPGTGKTLLAKAVATECNTTFFNISASSIVSKWRGDSEKLVRILFELARYHSPSTIFLDEIDAILSQRGDDSNAEHEASRRMKTELLIQMDGLSRNNDLVFVLAASNLPWELDHALLRRLDKKVLVPIPPKEARLALLRKLMDSYIDPEGVDLDKIADMTEGYSGSDILLVCKEAAMQEMRIIMDRLKLLDTDPKHPIASESVKLPKITMGDLLQSLKVTKPTAHLFKEKYSGWLNEFGTV